MLWARRVAYVTGTVNQELLLRNGYLGAENRILRGQIKGRLLLSGGEKATLAEIAQRLGRPTRWRNLDPSNLLAMSLRYQASSVSGFATAANSSKAFRS
jgi:hypothetical protein